MELSDNSIIKIQNHHRTEEILHPEYRNRLRYGSRPACRESVERRYHCWKHVGEGTKMMAELLRG